MEFSAVITPEIKDAANQRRTKESAAPANTSGRSKNQEEMVMVGLTFSSPQQRIPVHIPCH